MDRARPTDGRFVAFESNSQSASFDVVVVSSTTPQIRFARAGFNETVGCWMNGGELARRLQLQRDCIGGRKSEMIRMIPATLHCNSRVGPGQDSKRKKRDLGVRMTFRFHLGPIPGTQSKALVLGHLRTSMLLLLRRGTRRNETLELLALDTLFLKYKLQSAT